MGRADHDPEGVDHDSGSLDAAFADPPREYGPVPLWWWDGDELDDDRLTEQLEALAAGGVTGVCFISKYPHGPEGDQARYFSEEWWGHIEHVACECERLDLELWVHDETYHHSPPTWREYWQDVLRTEATGDPELRGRVLDRVAQDVTEGETATLEFLPAFTPLSVAAYPRGEGGLGLSEAVELDATDGEVRWTAPEGEYHVAAVGHRPEGLCYTSEAAAERYLELHFEEYDLLRAHDNFGRNDLAAGTEQYGDYYRTMRWYQAPGYDDGGPGAIGERNFFDAKLASSIAACYDRDRVWGELCRLGVRRTHPRTLLLAARWR